MSRAQSETVATVLTLAMVVITVSVIGYYLTGGIEADGEPAADIEGVVTANTAALAHQGGESIPGDELTVVLRYDGTESRYDFATDGSYGPDPIFDAGDRWELDGSVPYDPDDRVMVLLVHEPSNTVLFRGRKVAGTETATATPAPPA